MLYRSYPSPSQMRTSWTRGAGERLPLLDITYKMAYHNESLSYPEVQRTKLANSLLLLSLIHLHSEH